MLSLSAYENKEEIRDTLKEIPTKEYHFESVASYQKGKWEKPAIVKTPLLDDETLEKNILIRSGCGACKLTFIA